MLGYISRIPFITRCCGAIFCQSNQEDLEPISQSNQIHQKIYCQYHHSDLYCDITLYLATTIDLQLRSVTALWLKSASGLLYCAEALKAIASMTPCHCLGALENRNAPVEYFNFLKGCPLLRRKCIGTLLVEWNFFWKVILVLYNFKNNRWISVFVYIICVYNLWGPFLKELLRFLSRNVLNVAISKTKHTGPLKLCFL